MAEPLRPGDPRDVGGYTLTGRLGGGGMGQVFLGRSPGGRQVAVKLIRPEYAADPEFRARFAREVEAARRVGGFHTAAVVDADPQADPPWMATAYIPGPSLDAAVRRGGPLGLDRVRALGAALAEGLAAIHAAGLVHRDLKPSNIILADDGPRVIDFGIARNRGASTLTATGLVIGTLPYMSPEQVNGDPVGPESDVFSLGSVLTFAATGHGPFDAPSDAAVIHRVYARPPDLDGLTPALRELITSCLDKDAARRPALASLLAPLTVGPSDNLSADRNADPHSGESAVKPPCAGHDRTETVPRGEPLSVPARPPRRPGGPSAVTLTCDTVKTGIGPPITQAAFSFDGRLLAVSARDSAARLVDVAARRVAGRVIRGVGYPRFSRDGRLLLVAVRRTVGRGRPNESRLIEVATRKAIALPAPAWDSPLGIGMMLSPDGRLLVVTDNGGLLGQTYLWDTANRRLVDDTVYVTGPPEFSPNGRFLVGPGYESVEMYDITVRPFTRFTVDAPRGTAHLTSGDLGEEVEPEEEDDPDKGDRDCAWVFSPDSTLLAIAPSPWDSSLYPDNGVQVWDTVARQPRGPLIPLAPGMAAKMAFSPDGRLLAVAGAGGGVLVRDLSGSGPADRPLAVPGGRVRQLEFSPGGHLLAALDNSSRLRLWETATWRPVPGPDERDQYRSFAFSPGGRLLATHRLAAGRLDLWDTAALRPAAGRLEFTGPPDLNYPGPEGGITFSPDGQLLVTALGGLLQLWDLSSLG